MGDTASFVQQFMHCSTKTIDHLTMVATIPKTLQLM